MKEHTMANRPLLLLILDGWGHTDQTEHNAIALAKTPNWDKLWKTYPHLLISGSGLDVGLPKGQMGNSEVGHMTLGAGRTLYQDLTKIDQSIKSGNFQQNEALNNIIETTLANHSTLHICGLLSPGGVHSHESHLFAFLSLCQTKGLKQVAIHAFLDGRDTPPQSAKDSLLKLEAHCQKTGCGSIVSLSGRFYAMDRDKRWERTQQAYDLLTNHQAPFSAENALEALEMAYAREETDEFVQPTLIGNPTGSIVDNDTLLWFNFRADRARQLCHALTTPDFKGFERQKTPKLSHFVTFTQYDEHLHSQIAFPPEPIKNGLGECLETNQIRQLRISETEKYAHVTFFFNGGQETPFHLEERILIPSPKVNAYDQQPQMSAPEITQTILATLDKKTFDVIICNFANADMVGHTGNLKAAIEAVECLDDCIGQLSDKILKLDGQMMITADHGNVECMFNSTTQQKHTAHTSELVPFLYVGHRFKSCAKTGTLRDVAPSLLKALDLSIPDEMTGQSLLI